MLSATPNYGGWAIPVATDIAFALAVLSLFGKGLPPAARTFLMTLAVVDDLLGIILIAIFFATDLNFLFLGASLLVIALFGFLVQKRITHWYILVPLGILAWYFMHLSGIHATIAGVALGLTVPAKQRTREDSSLTRAFTEKLEFLSAGFVLPIFAFFAAGVNVVDTGGVFDMLSDPIAEGVYLGLPLGKFLGITCGVFIMTKVFPLRLENTINLYDIMPISLIAGIGFTVSLLIATLSFTPGTAESAHARVAVLAGTLISAVVGGAATKLRGHYRMRIADKTDIRTSQQSYQ